MNRAILLTGGNIGQRHKYLERALNELSKLGAVVAKSVIYETEAWGVREQAPFLNQAIVLRTELNATDLLREVLHIEEALGRIRKEKYGPRTIDIDIIFFNDDVISLPGLHIPHPQVQNRRFALQCLANIIPGYQHPVFKKNVDNLLSICADPLQARVWEGE